MSTLDICTEMIPCWIMLEARAVGDVCFNNILTLVTCMLFFLGRNPRTETLHYSPTTFSDHQLRIKNIIWHGLSKNQQWERQKIQGMVELESGYGSSKSIGVLAFMSVLFSIDPPMSHLRRIVIGTPSHAFFIFYFSLAKDKLKWKWETQG